MSRWARISVHCCDEALWVDGVESKQRKEIVFHQHLPPPPVLLRLISTTSHRLSYANFFDICVHFREWRLPAMSEMTCAIRTCFTAKDSTWDTTGRSHRIRESVARSSMDDNNSMVSPVTGITSKEKGEGKGESEREADKRRRRRKKERSMKMMMRKSSVQYIKEQVKEKEVVLLLRFSFTTYSSAVCLMVNIGSITQSHVF